MVGRVRAHAGLLLVALAMNAVAPVAGFDMPGWISLWVYVIGFIFIEFSLFGMHQRLRIDKHLARLAFFFWVLVSWRLAQSFWSVDFAVTIREVIKTAALFAFVFSAYVGLARLDRGALERINAIVVTTVIHLSFLVYLYLLITEIGGLAYFGSQAVKGSITLFGGPNSAGAVLMLLGAWNWLLVLSNTPSYRLLGVSNFLFGSVTLFGVASRTTLAGFLLTGLVVLLFALWKDQETRRWAVPITTFLGAFLVAVVWFSAPLIEVDDEGRIATLAQRYDRWEDGWRVLAEGAWLAGTGTATNGGLEWGIDGFEVYGQMHNALLQVWVEEGLIGLALYFGILVWLLTTGLKTRSPAGAVLVAIVLGMYLRNMGESNGMLWGLLNNPIVFVSWYITAHVLVVCRLDLVQEQQLTYGEASVSGIARAKPFLYKGRSGRNSGR